MEPFDEPITLGRSGIRTRPMGIGADHGIDAHALQWAFERGLNYFYWGSRRTDGMKEAIRALAPTHREEMIIALQTYDAESADMERTFHDGLRELKLDFADILILGRRDEPVERVFEDKAVAFKEEGLVKHLCISAHEREAYEAHLARGIYDLIMVRYNCAHTGAEQNVFPLVDAMESRPGVIVYNATRWSHLFDAAWMPEGEQTPEATHLYRHALSHPAVDMVLTAPRTQEQLDHNLEALAQGPLRDDEREWLGRVGRHVRELSPEHTWDFMSAGEPPKRSGG
jgi:predicted aldo/keto reductase-like oxidoreductase